MALGGREALEVGRDELEPVGPERGQRVLDLGDRQGAGGVDVHVHDGAAHEPIVLEASPDR